MHALVVDEQRARLGLLDERERRDVVPDRLIAESLALEVEQHPMLAVVEGAVDELGGVGERHVRDHHVAVEAGVLEPERGAGREPEPQAVTGALPVCPQRHVARLRMDQLGSQIGIPAEASAGQQRVDGPDHPALAGAVDDLGSDDRAIFHQQSLDGRLREQSRPFRLSHDPLAAHHQTGHVNRIAPAETEHTDRFPRSRRRATAPTRARARTPRPAVPSSAGSASGFSRRITSSLGAVHTNPAYTADPPMAGAFSTTTTDAPCLHGAGCGRSACHPRADDE